MDRDRAPPADKRSSFYILYIYHRLLVARIITLTAIPTICTALNMSRLINALVCLGVYCLTASARPFYETKPFWSNPCGNEYFLDVIEEGTFHSEQITWHEQLTKSFRKVKHQLKMARDQLEYKDFENLYIDVRRGIEERQYVPNWVPSKGNVEAILNTDVSSGDTLITYLPTLYTDLQKFSVAFEQVYKDEYDSNDNPQKKDALVGLIGQLRQLLCEVETGLWSLDISYDPPVSRDLMSNNERDIPDYTHRMVRDNGILLKYRDYLQGWTNLIRVKRFAKLLKRK